MSHAEDYPQKDIPRSVSGLDGQGARVWRPVVFTFGGSEWREDDVSRGPIRKASWRRWLLLSALIFGIAAAMAKRDQYALPTLGSAVQPLPLIPSEPLQPPNTQALAPASLVSLSPSPVVEAEVSDLELPAIALPNAPPVELMSLAASKDQQLETVPSVFVPVVPTFSMPPTQATASSGVEVIPLDETVQPLPALADTPLPAAQIHSGEAPLKAARPEDEVPGPIAPAPVTSDQQGMGSAAKVEPAKSRSAVTQANKPTRKEKQ